MLDLSRVARRITDRRARLAAVAALIVAIAGVIALAPVIGVVVIAIVVCLLVILFVVDQRLATQQAVVDQELAGQQAGDERKRRIDGALRMAVSPVAQASPEQIGIDPVDPGVLAQAISTEGRQMRYVRRAVDGRVRAALANARAGSELPLVCVNGASKAGKSRTLFEALNAELSSAALVVPRATRADLQTVLDDGVLPEAAAAHGGAVVLLLDDLEGFVRLGDSGLDREELWSLKHAIPGLVVAATTGGRGLDGPHEEAAQLFEPLRALRACGVTEQLPAALGTDAERRALSEVVPAGLARAMQDGLGAFAVSGQALVNMLTSERHLRVDRGEPCPEGAALVWAAVGAYQLGVAEPLPDELLRRLFACHARSPTAERYERARWWATTPLYGDVALLRGDEHGWVPFDYVVQQASSNRIDADRCVWNELLAFGRVGDALLIGTAAANRGALEDALAALALADRANDPAGANNLGVVLERLDRIDEAIEAYRHADDLGHPLGAANLAYLLKQRGDLDGARKAYERAEQRNSATGPFGLGTMAFQEHDIPAARAAWARAAAFGGWVGGQAAFQIAETYSDENDLESAEPWWRTADELGELKGTVMLGILREQNGDYPGARELYERAAAGQGDGAALGARCLGRLLEPDGDLAGAEQAYRRADELGDAQGAWRLSVLLLNRSEYRAAQHACLRAAERGDPNAKLWMYLLPDGPGPLPPGTPPLPQPFPRRPWRQPGNC